MKILLLLLCLTSTSATYAAWNDLLTDHVFDPTSFWYTPIPTDVELHPNSANFVTEFLRQKAAYYGTVTINTTQYSSPVYVINEETPLTTVTVWDCWKQGWTDKTLASRWLSVPFPVNALPSPGTDAEMTIYDPVDKTIYEFWKLQKDISGNWQACWGGRLDAVDTSDGIFEKYGATATGLPFLGGQITAEELIRGEIKHVMGIALVDVERAGIFSWPAKRSDGWNPTGAANRIPEGLRFRLDPTYNVEASKLSPVAKIIAKAAQKYGFVVWDTGGAIALRAQNPITHTQVGLTNLYPLIFKGAFNYQVLNGFPWSRLQFLPMDYGKK